MLSNLAYIQQLAAEMDEDEKYTEKWIRFILSNRNGYCSLRQVDFHVNSALQQLHRLNESSHWPEQRDAARKAFVHLEVLHAVCSASLVDQLRLNMDQLRRCPRRMPPLSLDKFPESRDGLLWSLGLEEDMKDKAA